MTTTYYFNMIFLDNYDFSSKENEIQFSFSVWENIWTHRLHFFISDRFISN